MSWQFHKRQSLLKVASALLPGTLTALAVLVLFELGVLQPLEQVAYKTLFRTRGSIPWDERIVVVAIDEPSLRQLGQFPWSRQRYATLINVLSESEASVVAFDILLSESSPDDEVLADAMVQYGRVVLAQAWDYTNVPLHPTPALREVAIAQGQIYKSEDTDGITRTLPPDVKGVLTLGLVTAQVYSLVREAVPPVDVNQPLYINWTGPVSQIPQYSFVDVIEGKIPAAAFQDKIVMVGITATGFDPLQTPFDANPAATSVFLHATVLNNLLQQNFLQVLPDGWFLFILLLVGPGLAMLLPYLSTRQQLGVLTGLCLAWLCLSALLFNLGYWVPMASPIALLTLTGGAVALSERLKENELLQREIARLWQAHHQHLVLRTDETTDPLIQAHGKRLLQPSVPLRRVAQLAALAEQFGRSHSTQAAIARNLSIGLVAADRDGLIWFCNPVAADWLQVRVGSRLCKALVPGWLSAEQWQARLEALYQGQDVATNELQWGDRWFALILEPLIYHPEQVPLAGSPDGLLLMLEDITSRKQIEENLNRQVQEMHEMAVLKDDFISTVSHELRAPLTNMKMAIHMLRSARSAEQHDRYLKVLQDECARETSLINDLLDLQRLEAGAKAMRLEPIDLQAWLPHLMESFHERADARQLTLILKLPIHLPALQSDESGLERLLVELINNACKYTPPHEMVTVEVTDTPTHLCFSVTNSGIEIPAEELSRIFDRFYRVPSGDRWKQGGTGLGLALVKKIAEYLGGTIQVTSQTGETTFTVHLPLILPEADPCIPS
ncbi:CHASE2 domain-containing protein [Oculatella sp. LEGE 06141]|uniref:CHASE2 domain-containing protein n=1 Tax=Oculatella sp. LEGE 06141 TaxID=1828648 RepID=UPI00187EDFA3|nr:CHASE2 domain-containing protein [Oculatella sp. LEGE 06141]MBE9177180.1 CHASE2 domain-containing protein [Oculatella sp. LEGE 06141]